MKALLACLVCAGCDVIWRIDSISGPAIDAGVITCLALAGCHDGGQGNPDAATDTSSSPSDARIDASPIPTDAPSGCHASVGTAGASCDCIYDGAGCNAGLACYWQFQNDNPPKQTSGKCAYLGSVALGGTCMLSAISPCVEGAWCMLNSNSGATGTGNCRKVCDPTAGGCPSGQTCIDAPYCTNPSDYTSCQPATSGHVGYCQ